MNLTILYIIYALLLLVLSVGVWITLKKIKKDPYNPYYLKHVQIAYSIGGAIFLIASFILLLFLH